eukprot:CAMPEP_0171825328 /NCGR_PEP_ID=MMETSP0992-20121227/5477_1 /TAXON_ID=483369 /ORGANISM="non described non described, Strain CCMP2098" /LENGTH=159 /DNA_ID=CAMNT_0012440249 /DNA_START=65 /DNA_END=543 /DNA_ORIENTATION=+
MSLKNNRTSGFRLFIGPNHIPAFNVTSKTVRESGSGGEKGEGTPPPCGLRESARDGAVTAPVSRAGGVAAAAVVISIPSSAAIVVAAAAAIAAAAVTSTTVTAAAATTAAITARGEALEALSAASEVHGLALVAHPVPGLHLGAALAAAFPPTTVEAVA